MLLDLHEISQEAGQVVWYFISLRVFHSLLFHTVKGFGIVNKAETDIFLELSCFFYDPVGAGNLISGSSAFSKSCCNIWKFMVHILLKSSLEKVNRKHKFRARIELFWAIEENIYHHKSLWPFSKLRTSSSLNVESMHGGGMWVWSRNGE